MGAREDHLQPGYGVGLYPRDLHKLAGHTDRGVVGVRSAKDLWPVEDRHARLESWPEKFSEVVIGKL